MKNAIRERKSKVLGLFLCFLLLGIDYSFASYNNYSQFKTLSVSVSNSTNGQVIELEKQDCSRLLSDREKTILQLIDMGKTSHEIARELFISKNTVSRHRQNILEKLQVKNSIEACRIAKELKLLF